MFVLCAKRHRILICGDCILKRITPNPILSPDPVDPTKQFRSLAEYLREPCKLAAAIRLRLLTEGTANLSQILKSLSKVCAGDR